MDYTEDPSSLLCGENEDGRWGVINKNGQVLSAFNANCEPDFVDRKNYYLSGGYVVFQNSSNNEWYRYNVCDDKTIKLGNYDEISAPKDGLAVVRKNNLYGVLNLVEKQEVFPCKFKFIEVYWDFIAIWNNDVYTFANRTGQIISKSKYLLPKYDRDYDDENGHFKSFCAINVDSHKMGAIDDNGNIIVPFIYDYITPFNKNGFALYNTSVIF